MCGIAGWLDLRPQPAAPEALARMIASLHHRGPDDEGVWLGSDGRVGLGARRLAIVDLTASGHQPMRSHDDRYTVAFNGEIYNFEELRRSLTGYPFVGRSDTEVILASVARWGIEGALRRFNGMFALAIWDDRERTLHMARDRMGEKPLYWSWTGSLLLFGSELKALRQHPAFDDRIDRQALALFFRHKYVPAPWSIYRDVRKLHPGTLLSITAPPNGSAHVEERRYWSFEDAAHASLAAPLQGTADETATQLEELLLDAVGLRMQADVPLGAFLSGGIDSSAIVALMQAQSPQPVRTFTIGFHDADFDEAAHARAVAGHLGTDHTELYVSPGEAMDVIPRLPEIYDEPFADSSQIPTYLVSALAREQVTVALSGDGGDELFGGYNRYSWGAALARRAGRTPRFARRMLAGAMRGVSPSRWDAMFRALGPALPRSLRQRSVGDKMQKMAAALAADSPQAFYLDLVSHWKEPASLVLGTREPQTTASDPERWPALPSVAHQMMFLDAITYLPDDILAKVDRATMATSLEARVPYLDHRVVELAWRIPMSMKIRDGQSKWLLRSVLGRHVPSEMFRRPKAGFGIPIGAWLRGPLRAWAEDLLDPARIDAEGFLSSSPITARWTEHLQGRRNWQYPLWDVLMFQSWLERTRGEVPSAAAR